MKRCAKLPEPATLAAYRQANPQGTWDQMKNDAFNDGQQAAIDVKRTLVKGQRCLCAYCEMRIAEGTADAEIDASKPEQRVEHFHPKDDRTTATNWNLRWQNLWAVCQGGSQRPPTGVPADDRRYLPPLPENLSCDAYKDHQIDGGKLNACPEGWILAPDEVPAFPLLFQFSPDGIPEPHGSNCAAYAVPGNRYPDTQTLVAKTIEHLNLGCTRLTRPRRVVREFMERQIEQARQASGGLSPQVVLKTLAGRLFSQMTSTPWPEFFTLIRWRLGGPAEDHLLSINYAG